MGRRRGHVTGRPGQPHAEDRDGSGPAVFCGNGAGGVARASAEAVVRPGRAAALVREVAKGMTELARLAAELGDLLALGH